MTAAALPYVGPRALADGERLYGRTHEVEDLLDLLVANRVALLYSPSGAGKTSLIAAGLLPRLREEGFTVAPIVRIDRPLPREREAEADRDRFLESLLASLEGDPGFAASPADDSAAPGDRLTALLQAHATEDLVLVLDQFETLFTLDPGDRAAKVAFMTALGSLVNRRLMAPAGPSTGEAVAADPRPWLLIVLREEFLAALDPYRHLIPGGLGARMRLELLDPDRARRAIQGPAAAVGVTIEDDAAQALVDDLCAVQETDDAGIVQTVPGATVEPVQLQVTCLRLWLQLRPEEGASITAADLPPAAGVTEALGAYYAEAVAGIAGATGTSELSIRDWFGDSLIVQHAGRSIRAQVRDGVSPPIRAACEDAHLVRGDERAGVRWYELAHDRLVTPVIEDNARWLREHARPLLLRARAWQVGGRDRSLLLRGKDLEDARRIASGATDLTAEEGQLLEASIAMEHSVRRGRRQRQAFVGLVGIMGALVLAAAWLALSFSDQARKTTAGRLAVLAERQIPWIASVQRLLAADLSGGTQPILATASCCAPELRRIVTTTGGRITAVAFGARGEGVVWAQEGGPTLTRLLGATPPVTLKGLGDVRAMAWSPDRDRLAVGDGRGRVRLVDGTALEHPDAPDVAADATPLRMPAASPEAARQAAAASPGIGGAPTGTPGPSPAASVTAITWSADGSTVAAALADGGLVVWRSQDASAPDATSDPIALDARMFGSRPVRIALSGDGRLIAATADLGGQWAVWDVAAGAEPRTVAGIKGGVVAFLPGEPPRLLVGGEAGRLAVVSIRALAPPVGGWTLAWDGRLRTPGDAAAIRDLAVQTGTDGRAQVGIARKNGTIQVIAVDTAGEMSLLSESLAADPDEAEHLAWSPDGTSLVATGRGRALSVWSVLAPGGDHRDALPPLAVAVLPSGIRVAVAADGRITRTGSGAAPFAGSAPIGPEPYQAAAIAPDGTSVALARPDAPIVVVRDRDAAPLSIADSATPDRVTDVVFDRSGTRLAVATARQVRAWDLSTDPPTPLGPTVRLPELNPRTQVAFDAAGSGLYVAGCDSFSPGGAACLHGTVAWHPIGADAAAAATRPVRELAVEGWPWSLAVDPADAATVAVGLKNGRVAVLRLDASTVEPEVLHSSELVPNNAITDLAYAAQGPARLAVGSMMGRVLLVDPDGLWVVAENVGGSHREVTALAYATDGTRIAIGSGTSAFPRPAAAPGTDPIPSPAPDRITGAVQVLALDAPSLRARVCDLAAWMSKDDERTFLLGQSHPTCTSAATAAP